MEILKQILTRHDERCDLYNMCLCLVMTLALVTVAFGLANLEFDFHSPQGGFQTGRAPIGIGGEFRLP